MTYLGYALDDENPEIVPWDDRPVRAYILSKRVQYFYDYFGKPMIGRDQITKAYHELRKEFPTFEFVGGFIDDRTDEEKEKQGPMEVPEGVRNLGKLNQAEWDREVGNSRAMVGIGWPPSSPSPYYALARGVPFINPVGRAAMLRAGRDAPQCDGTDFSTACSITKTPTTATHGRCRSTSSSASSTRPRCTSTRSSTMMRLLMRSDRR